MFKNIVILITLILTVCQCQPDPVPLERGGAPTLDPFNTAPCENIFGSPVPEPPTQFSDWDESLLSDDWWPYVMIASNNSVLFSQFPRESNCTPPWSPVDESEEIHHPTKSPERRITYFWQSSCPYKASWLGKFTQRVPGKKFDETCYLLWPCCQQVRIVKCNTTICNTGTYCKDDKIPHKHNSVCLETHFREYKDIYVFCPITYVQENGDWVGIDCRSNPHRCLKLVTISVPQCCECWSCRGKHDH
ncbi:uncharacterized protein LOC132736806 [Ruditapes philippinarum]|uniref:uncharacterized protein LOC132736806 n=1 Tax=Ruditapes philippinarum TaxID=129788 RepID=UPI00295B0B14|nr:uncharacterized protein LOC132736806 [Ruditapes philippinarum]